MLCMPERRGRGLRLGRLALPLLLLLLLPYDAARGQSSVSSVVERCFPAVVHVSVRFKAARGSRGGSRLLPEYDQIERAASGVLVSPSGLVVTNAHLVAEVPDGELEEGAEFWLDVQLGDYRSYPATVITRDERVDLALLQLDLDDAETVPALPLARLAGRELGERLVALGLPRLGSRRAFAGSLAFCGGPVKLHDALLAHDDTILTDARFHDVLDGGPLLDSNGRIVGIHNAWHITSLPPGFGTEEGEKEAENTDYAVIISAETIRKTFEAWLPAAGVVPLPIEHAEPEQATVAIAAIAASIVSVWTGAAEERPNAPDPEDPHARRIPSALGSGVVVDPLGLVLTSSDLFEGDTQTATVRVASGATYEAKLVGVERPKKIALLKLALPEGTRLDAADFADFSPAIVGEGVVVVGRPFVDMLTVSVGVLSALERDGLVQVASWVHRGHWGGALVDRTGRLLGIAVDRLAEEGGIAEHSYLGFAAPLAATLEWFDEEWKEHASTERQDAVTARDEDQLDLRRTAVARVVERTQGSFLNVVVKRANAEQAQGFSPFDEAETERNFKPLGRGSGVIIDESGLALSNWHVVDAALVSGREESPDHRVEVTLHDGRSYTARVLSTSRDDDLALLALQIDDGEYVEPVELGDSDRLLVGEPVVAIGNPYGLSDSVSAGIVSAKNERAHIQGRAWAYDGLLMTDAAINPGNSGGALLDLDGRLVGINSAGRVGLGLAIPVNRARKVFSDKLLSAERLRSAYLGLKVEEQGDQVRIAWVDPHGPGQRAEFQIGDWLLRVGDHDIRTTVDFARARLRARAGTPLPIRIERHGDEHTVEVDPLSYAAWTVFRQSGIEVTQVDYREESQLLREASVSLFRAYAGDPNGQPVRLMDSALRVVRVRSENDNHPLKVREGDLLLGMNTVAPGRVSDRYELTRFERVAELLAAFEPHATIEGEECECWLLRDGKILSVDVFVRRP